MYAYANCNSNIFTRQVTENIEKKWTEHFC